ncbi:protein downstream neighbor of son homolog [Diabrotica virgifera virgifera]|uniref:Protein downstream neighbor of son homolog n=1 Tax=Diabrotica virgifera virgifera TaxID=50390 RepID=A0A6P7F227_DIAVI|nr:protein downstream neighbor of son homolog [Diabrotica virgifera virgifera]
MTENPETTNIPKWLHPTDVMKLHKLKQKKKALQARIKGTNSKQELNTTGSSQSFENIFAAQKRTNPFVTNSQNKKIKTEQNFGLDESTDQTLFKLFNQKPLSSPNGSFTSFSDILNKINADGKGSIEVVKAQGENWLPIDWALKDKLRLISSKPFPWSQKLKVSEEASGITAFARCLNNDPGNNLDSSPNAKFHQCCLYWMHPHLPWMSLFPRISSKVQSAAPLNSSVRESLQQAWSDSLRSLFQLIRTRQCPYFYACANSFTVLFRAAGISGFTDLHVLITPTTKGFRNLLKQEEVEFTMPLKKTRTPDQEFENKTTSDSKQTQETEDQIENEDIPDETWMKSMGIDDKEIKRINYSQEKMISKIECEVDNSDQSLVMIEGGEVNGFYNFFLNCKSSTALTGHLAGVPPTLLAPVAFHGASLNSLKVKESKVYIDDSNYYSLELSGPILPSMTHNLFAVSRPEHSLTATYNNLRSTECFSQVKNTERRSVIERTGTVVFGTENLSDCGLSSDILKHFCAPDKDYVTNVECLKYTSENNTFTWS